MGTAEERPGPERGEARTAGEEFEIRIKGRVGEAFRTAFAELAVTVNPPETILHGAGLDQAALYGILDRIQALGLELVEVRRLPGGRGGANGPGPARRT
ncbi:hypothetical protein [Streptomyces cylindrosporus]|uniref:Uncharacterized protein n=1 Tax=Streptomyces cylindrosporus TaxID=2927583 RepID=A0ABS9YRQ0_9ACTN|nr:hypothetical protein [Streptomyces cylindrosporus]MCI3278806.1 hypothetical protein [Streptomyces cylindrosporus]